MNIQSAAHRSARLLVVSLACGACLLGGTLPAVAAEERKDSAGFIEKMKKWEDQMTDKFRDMWQGWRGKIDGKSLALASVDLREKQESYTLRLNLPERDLSKVDIRLEGESLRILAPEEGKVGRYEQVVTLANVAPQARLQIERKEKDNLIVVTVPKAAAVADAKPSSPKATTPDLLPWDDAERDMFARMEKMRREMDRIFEESFREFRIAPDQRGFFDLPRFGSSLDVQEEGDNYVVRAYLPDRNIDNVNVTIEGQTLKVEAKAEETEKKERDSLFKSHKAHYAQVVTLPGPVKGEKMKVDKKEGMLVITVPKV